MLKRYFSTITCLFLINFTLADCLAENGRIATNRSGDYDDLVKLFNEFREFQEAEINNGVPDYTAVAVNKQYRGLKKFQKRLAEMDIEGWPVWQKVDYHLVRAEMNALEFHHRVFKPWAKDPGFYSIRSGDAGSSIKAESFLSPLFELFEMESPLSMKQQGHLTSTNRVVIKAIPSAVRPIFSIVTLEENSCPTVKTNVHKGEKGSSIPSGDVTSNKLTNELTKTNEMENDATRISTRLQLVDRRGNPYSIETRSIASYGDRGALARRTGKTSTMCHAFRP